MDAVRTVGERWMFSDGKYIFSNAIKLVVHLLNLDLSRSD